MDIKKTRSQSQSSTGHTVSEVVPESFSVASWLTENLSEKEFETEYEKRRHMLPEWDLCQIPAHVRRSREFGNFVRQKGNGRFNFCFFSKSSHAVSELKNKKESYSSLSAEDIESVGESTEHTLENLSPLIKNLSAKTCFLAWGYIWENKKGSEYRRAFEESLAWLKTVALEDYWIVEAAWYNSPRKIKSELVKDTKWIKRILEIRLQIYYDLPMHLKCDWSIAKMCASQAVVMGKVPLKVRRDLEFWRGLKKMGGASLGAIPRSIYENESSLRVLISAWKRNLGLEVLIKYRCGKKLRSNKEFIRWYCEEVDSIHPLKTVGHGEVFKDQELLLELMWSVSDGFDFNASPLNLLNKTVKADPRLIERALRHDPRNRVFLELSKKQSDRAIERQLKINASEYKQLSVEEKCTLKWVQIALEENYATIESMPQVLLDELGVSKSEQEFIKSKGLEDGYFGISNEGLVLYKKVKESVVALIEARELTKVLNKKSRSRTVPTKPNVHGSL